MTTTLTLRNAVSAFVRGRNRWEPALLIPIQIEESILPREEEHAGHSKAIELSVRLRSILRRHSAEAP